MNWMLIAIVSMLLGFMLRLRFYNKIYGTDTSLFLTIAKQIWKRKRLPRIANSFLLDEKFNALFDYPPLFPFLLSFFHPEKIKRCNYLIQPILETIHMLILFALTLIITHNPLVASLSILFYALTPIAVQQSLTVNTRIIGSLFFTLTLLSIIQYNLNRNWLFFFSAVIFGALILITNKLTTQALVLIMIVLSILFLSPLYLIVLLPIFIAAMILSKGKYLGVLKGHLRLLKWHRNNPTINMQTIFQFFPKTESNISFRDKVIKLARTVYKTINPPNPFLFFLLFALANNKSIITTNNIYSHLFAWIATLTGCTILISFIPSLQFLGEGSRYQEYISFPVSLLSATCLVYNSGNYSIYIVFAIFIVISLVVDIRHVIVVLRDELATLSKPLSKVCQILKDQKGENIICIPFSMVTLVGLITEKKIFWGLSTISFVKGGDFFPILKREMPKTVDKFDLDFVVVDKKYTNRKIQENLPYYVLHSDDRYMIYRTR